MNNFNFALSPGDLSYQGVFDRRMEFCEDLLVKYKRDASRLITSCPDCSRFFAICCPDDKLNRRCHHYRLIFTDGACLSNEQSGATAGMGVALGQAGVGQDQWSIPIDDTVDPFPTRSSQRAELLAAIEGLRLLGAHDRQSLHPAPRFSERTAWVITTDSEYVVKGITEWFPTWKANNWRGSQGRRPANLDLFQKLDEEITAQERRNAVRIGFWHVRRENNTLADSLAKRAAQNASPAPIPNVVP